MFMPKLNRVAIYEYLFKEGVMVAEKSFHLSKHPELDVPNLHVIKTLQSLKSRGYVKEQFSWRYYYWYLTNEGIQYLREFLHLPPEIVPATLKRQVKTDQTRSRISGVTKSDNLFKPSDDRTSYRRPTNIVLDKKSEAGPGAAALEFRGGFGRGRPL